MSDATDLESRLKDLESRSDVLKEHSQAQEKVIKQLIAEHVTQSEQISLLFTLVLDDMNLEQLGGVN